MGAFLDKPKTEKTNAVGTGPDYQYAVSSMQGWRTDMEDAHDVKVSISEKEPFKNWSFFAVFDGHAGSRVALHSSENLLQYLLDTQEFKGLVSELEKSKGEVTEKAKELITNGIKAGFLKLDEHMSHEKGSDGEQKEKSGTTAVCAILSPDYIFFGNLGDSRGMLGRLNQEVFFTIDHKPFHEQERNRIVKAGGTVMIQRVNGSLAVSRALGDYDYKKVPGLAPSDQLVSPEPDVYILKRNKTADQFLVLACDGIYDVINNEDLCHLIRSRLSVTDDLQASCNQILDYCLARGSRDNMTMILVCFDAAPKKDEKLAAAEAKWTEEVRAKAQEYADCAKSSIKDFSGELLGSILQNKTYLDNSPAWGGLDLLRPMLNDIADDLLAKNNIEREPREQLHATRVPSHEDDDEDMIPASSQELQSENNGV
ncbi:PPM-type phosphatase domain-containing protein [Aphelenchoides besseyi]|nr:PPM-type phosphatase domain-containing protein [Aphelenchoides besseyi]